MKAKELAQILLEHPEREITYRCHNEHVKPIRGYLRFQFSHISYEDFIRNELCLELDEMIEEHPAERGDTKA